MDDRTSNTCEEKISGFPLLFSNLRLHLQAQASFCGNLPLIRFWFDKTPKIRYCETGFLIALPHVCGILYKPQWQHRTKITCGLRGAFFCEILQKIAKAKQTQDFIAAFTQCCPKYFRFGGFSKGVTHAG